MASGKGSGTLAVTLVTLCNLRMLKRRESESSSLERTLRSVRPGKQQPGDLTHKAAFASRSGAGNEDLHDALRRGRHCSGPAGPWEESTLTRQSGSVVVVVVVACAATGSWQAQR